MLGVAHATHSPWRSYSSRKASGMSCQLGGLIVADWVQSNWVYNCTIVASAALAFYDYFTTFGREVELMWGRKSSSVTLLFHANRWSNIAWAIVNLMQLNLGSPMYESMLLQHIQSCLSLGLMGSILDVVRYTLWAAFSGIRVYAISRGSWALTALVILLSLVPAGMTAYSDFGEWTDSIADIPGIGVWCLPSAKITTRALTTDTVVERVPAIVADVLVLFITWYQTSYARREAGRCGMKTPVATMLVRNGTVCFALLLALNVLNIAGEVTNVFVGSAAFSTVLSSITVSHFLLDLRQLVYEQDLHVTDTLLSTRRGGSVEQYSASTSLIFASFVDNMGEDLVYSFDSQVQDSGSVDNAVQ